MSKTAAWSYTNVATIKPFSSVDLRTQATIFGTEFEIACTWTATSEMVRDAGGQGGSRMAEFVSQHMIFTEDDRVKYLDMIHFDGSNGWEQIRSVTNWDMSFFGETPDYKLVT